MRQVSCRWVDIKGNQSAPMFGSCHCACGKLDQLADVLVDARRRSDFRSHLCRAIIQKAISYTPAYEREKGQSSKNAVKPRLKEHGMTLVCSS